VSVLGCKGHFLCLLCISFLILFLQAMGQFEQMSSRNYIEIDGVIFVVFFFLLACKSHWAFVDEVLGYFESMGSVPQLWNTRCLHRRFSCSCWPCAGGIRPGHSESHCQEL